MARDMNQRVQGHTQENKAMSKSNSFENCTFHGFTINIYPGTSDDEQAISFTSKSSGNVTSTQALQLPNDVDTIIKVLTHCHNNGIEAPLVLPESVSLPAIEHKTKLGKKQEK